MAATQLASAGQLRMGLVRWLLVTVPLILLAGYLSGRAGGGAADPWFRALDLPPAQPPDRLFGLAWTILYALMGVALALVLHARGARGRGVAVAAFLVQLALNLAWSPLFFGMHQVSAAYWLLIAILVAATATTFLFGRVRPLAAWLMVPYLCWLGFAAVLAHEVDERNPDAETLVVPAARTQIG